MNTIPSSPRSTVRSARVLDDDVARALIRAQVRRRHRRVGRVLTRV